MIPTAITGAGLGIALTIVALLSWGGRAAVATALFAVLATAIQLGSLALMGPVKKAQLAKFMARWGAGMGLRFLGIGILTIAIAADKTLFPPLAASLGFLGVLLPLLVLEARLLK